MLVYKETQTCPKCEAAWVAMELGLPIPFFGLKVTEGGRYLECPNSECEHAESLLADAMMLLLNAPLLPGYVQE